MKILVINCGSSSLKYQFIDMTDESVLAKGLVERIGIDGSVLKHEKTGMDKKVFEQDIPDHGVALQLVLDALVNNEHGVISSLDEITAVGHRVVHGGEKFAESVLINDDVIKAIEECNELAPLHNPANLIGINACRKILKDIPMVAVFDTAFHQTMPKSSYLYALPLDYYKNYSIRRYGFHGTSHKYVMKRAAEILGKSENDLNIITCHLGNGASVTAIKNGKSVDTSMGFTPLEGLIMGTRCGDMDPAIVTYIMEKEKLSPAQMDNVMNKKSGVLGLSGLSSDFRDIESAAKDGNEDAKNALDCYHNRVKKYIGSYIAILGRVDAVIFTAGLGENSATSRAAVCEGLEVLGIEIDLEKNNTRGEEKIVSKDSSKVKVIVVPTNEEVMIARDTKALAEK